MCVMDSGGVTNDGKTAQEAMAKFTIEKVQTDRRSLTMPPSEALLRRPRYTPL